MSSGKLSPFVKKSLPPRLAPEPELRPLHLYGVYLNWVSVRSAYHYGLHQHSQYELIIPPKGIYRCVLNAKKLDIPPGHILFIQDGDWHEDFYRKGNVFASVLFNLHDYGGANWPHGVFSNHSATSSRDISLSRNSQSRTLLKMVLDEGKKRQRPSIVVETLVDAFFWVLVERFPREYLGELFLHSMVDNAFCRQLFDLFALYTRKKISIGALAAMLGISERTLDMRCRSILGTTPAKALAAHRMQEAVRLFSLGMKVKEVSDNLGFADPFHFSKVFRRIMGYPPSSLFRGFGDKPIVS